MSVPSTPCVDFLACTPGRTSAPRRFGCWTPQTACPNRAGQNPDGTGLGVFDEHGRPQVHKQPIAAWQDADFATEAHEMTGTTFVAHVRYATTGSLDVRNTHPFLQDGRIFAHNGVVEGLDVIDERLREVGTADLVLGQTDSERVFALITASIRARGGDVSAGLVDAMRWLAANVPIYAVNVLLSTATDMWALRYPDAHQLYVLDRRYDANQRQGSETSTCAPTEFARGLSICALGRRWCSPASRWTTTRAGVCWTRASWSTSTPGCRSPAVWCCRTRPGISCVART